MVGCLCFVVDPWVKKLKYALVAHYNIYIGLVFIILRMSVLELVE